MMLLQSKPLESKIFGNHLFCINKKILILDEITNNLDLKTKDHVIQLLKAFPGDMLAISHEADFLEEIGITEVVDVEKFK